jgi:hypothetical protein
MSRNQRFVLLGLAVVVVVVAAVIIGTSGGSDDDDSSSADSGPVTIQVKDEKPVGGIQKIDVKKGDPVQFTVDSDSAQEIHVHGYDFEKDVPANGKVSFSFPAKIDGSFVIELEEPGVQIAALNVSP